MRGAHQAFFLDDNEKARRGYVFMYGNADDWDVIRACHEKSMCEAMGEVLAEREREKEERETKGRDASQGRKRSFKLKQSPSCTE